MKVKRFTASISFAMLDISLLHCFHFFQKLLNNLPEFASIALTVKRKILNQVSAETMIYLGNF
jgi:hypothetical protein